MPYCEMLLKILQEKKLTDREVINRCKRNGVDISEAYFSRIKNNKKNPPSEKISRAIAKACEVDERLLVIEGYIDKSPKEIREAFTSLDFMAKSLGAKYMDLIQNGDIKKLKNRIENLPVSDTVIQLLNDKENYIHFLENNYMYESLGNGLALSMTIKEPIGFDIDDDAMLPILQKGDKVRIELTANFCSSDILLVKIKNQKKPIARYIYKVNDTVRLVPICKTYKEIICKRDEITILGRVNHVIRKI